MTKKHLITSAFPYANGPLHFGHLAGVYLPADIYSRHLKLKGVRAIHISGSDEHGVAIMQNAQKEKKKYQEYVDFWHEEHKSVFNRYQIKFDFFGQTSKDYHRDEVLNWFKVLHDKGYIEKRQEQQLQCQDCHNFLPDRFVEGKCYVCGYAEARGDECPECGTWIDPLKLIDPVCKFCASKNIMITPSHQWYLVLSKFYPSFKKWFKTKSHWRNTVVPFVDSLSKDNLHDRAITRDLDWGIDVPLAEAAGKKLYVWFDAPIGYVSNTKEYLKQIGSPDHYLKDWWNNNDTVITNFIGKDNIIFHSIIFPVMSMASEIVRPVDELPANQYLNLFGKQFSKSKGWYIDSNDAIDRFGVDAMRYYLISLIPETSDSSFTWSGFEAKVNNELANNIGNFINRSMKFYFKNWPAGISHEKFQTFFDNPVFKEIEILLKEMMNSLDAIEIKKAIELLMKIGHQSNLYFSSNEPWSKIKTEPEKAEELIAHCAIITLLLGIYFQPFLPSLSDKILSYFDHQKIDQNLKDDLYRLDFKTLKTYLVKNPLNLIQEPSGLVPKIDAAMIKELEASFKA